MLCTAKVLLVTTHGQKSESESELLLVTRQNDNHTPGP